jgi:hypothetical protein
MSECNVDDILCQLRTLENLRQLRDNIGSESFRSKFPELVELEPKLTAEIEKTDATLKETINRCGNLNVDEIPELEPIEEE